MHKLNLLPLPHDIETTAVLKKLAKAHQALAELKGVVAGIPNQSILISTLSLQEAKDSSAIENIVTTHDDLYRSDSVARHFVSVAAKEVHGGTRHMMSTPTSQNFCACCANTAR